MIDPVELERVLSEFLDPEMNRIVQAVINNELAIRLPDSETADAHPAEISSLIARSANNYAMAARWAGIARAQMKLAKGRYDRKFKSSRVGRNEAEREANAMEAAAHEHATLAVAEALVEMADTLEAAARIASESIRRIALSANAHYSAATSRAGSYSEDDFRPY